MQDFKGARAGFTAGPYSTTTTFTIRTLSEGFCFINPMTIMSLSCSFQMKLSAQSVRDERGAVKGDLSLTTTTTTTTARRRRKRNWVTRDRSTVMGDE